MNTFGQLVEITTENKDLVLEKISLNLENKHLKKLDLEYFYDIKNHSIYLNLLDKNDIGFNIIEEAINKIFFVHNPKKEIDSFLGNLMNPSHKKPKVFYFTYSNNKEFVSINKVNLSTKRNSNLEILELKIWSINYSS